MLADTEYHDPSCWREIARENGILNPRKVDYTRRLKIPALYDKGSIGRQDRHKKGCSYGFDERKYQFPFTEKKI